MLKTFISKRPTISSIFLVFFLYFIFNLFKKRTKSKTEQIIDDYPSLNNSELQLLENSANNIADALGTRRGQWQFSEDEKRAFDNLSWINSKEQFDAMSDYYKEITKNHSLKKDLTRYMDSYLPTIQNLFLVWSN